MEKIIPFKAKDLSYDILTDTAGSLAEEIYGRYNIGIIGDGTLRDSFSSSLEAGRDILYICISGLESAEKEAAELMAAYPGRRIVCAALPSASEDDSLSIIRMSRLRAAGATLDEVTSYYKNHRKPSPVSFPASRFSWPVATAISM